MTGEVAWPQGRGMTSPQGGGMPPSPDPLWSVSDYLSSLVLRGSDFARLDPDTSAVLALASAVLAGGLFCGFRKFWTCCSALRRSCSCCSFTDCCADDVPPVPGIADPTPNEWPNADPAARWPTCPGFDVPAVDKLLLTSTHVHHHFY